MIPWEPQRLMAVEEKQRETQITKGSIGALRSHCASNKDRNHHDGGARGRKLQSGGGAVMLESLTFFAIVMAFALAVWLCCRISIRATRRAIRRGEADDIGDADAGSGAHMEQIDWYTLQQRARARAGLPRGTGASSWFGVPASSNSRQQRRSFLEKQLLRQKYVPTKKPDSTTESEPSGDDDESAEDNSRACAICLEEYNEGDEVCPSSSRRCKHVFHRNCIMDWLMSDETCPCCRQTFVAFPDCDEIGPADATAETGLEMGTIRAAADDAATTAELSTSANSQSSRFPSSLISSGSLSSLFLGSSRHSSVGAFELEGGTECDPTSEAADQARERRSSA